MRRFFTIQALTPLTAQLESVSGLTDYTLLV